MQSSYFKFHSTNLFIQLNRAILKPEPITYHLRIGPLFFVSLGHYMHATVGRMAAFVTGSNTMVRQK